MNDKQKTVGKCPIPNCGRGLVYHAVYGVGTTDPLVFQVTKNIYECAEHGLFAFLGDGKFRQIQT
jgi:hypothetical protein